jgi:acyl CoA:acetate/3-ketoacid CoA transferase beta subunit
VRRRRRRIYSESVVCVGVGLPALVVSVERHLLLVSLQR